MFAVTKEEARAMEKRDKSVPLESDRNKDRDTSGNEIIPGESTGERHQRYQVMNAFQSLRHATGVRFDLIPVRALIALADMYEAGTKKYLAWDWWTDKRRREVFPEKLERHYEAYINGEKRAFDNKHPHLMSVVFHAFALYEYDAHDEGVEKVRLRHVE